MRRELEQKLVEHWPSWFNVTGGQRETRMADGFAHGDGWFNIVWRLCEYGGEGGIKNRSIQKAM